MISKRSVREALARHIGLRAEYNVGAHQALDEQDYSAAAAMCHRAHQQQRIIDTLEALLR